MSASTWLVPLNVHHSLSLRTVAKNSGQLQNISTSIFQLTVSLQSLEKSAFEIAGSTNKILSLLESKEHKESTIAAMRMLIFRHNQTCSEAKNEEDKLTALASCIVSEKLLHQNWFNLDLFSHASFDEMSKADEILRSCSNIIDNLRSEISEEESIMIEKLPLFLKEIEEISNLENDLLRRLVYRVQNTGWGSSGCDYSGYTKEIKVPFFGVQKQRKDFHCVQYKLELSDGVWKNEKWNEKIKDKPRWQGREIGKPDKADFPKLITFGSWDSTMFRDEDYISSIGFSNFLNKMRFNPDEINNLEKEVKKEGTYGDYKPGMMLKSVKRLKQDLTNMKTEKKILDERTLTLSRNFDEIFQGRLRINNE